MTLLLVGFGGFVLSLILVLVGRRIAQRELNERRRLGVEALDPFFSWFKGVLKEEWPILRGEHSGTGERIAAWGSVLGAISVIAMLGGIVVVVAAAVT